jgi:EmrB/QacA subfamily drug resistance transporter
VWRVAFTIVVGAMAVVFDTTIVSVALNDLAKDLHTTISTIQWVSTGYLLAMFVTIPITGWAQSVIGGKRLWILALGVFLLGSILSACAWSAASLIGFRVLQGVGGGVMMPLLSTLIMQAADGRNVGKVMSVVSLPTTLGPILGPVLGGIILTFGDWRWMFLVNIPFCVIGAYFAFRNLPEDRPAPADRTRLDTFGLMLLSPGVAAIIYGLSQAEGSAGITSAKVLVPLLAGLALVSAFVLWALPRKAALVNVRLLHHRSLASSSICGFLSGATLYGAMLLLPLYWQQVRGEDALGAGLLLIPQGIGTMFSRAQAGKYTDRYGPRWVAFTGFAVVTAATVPFAFVTAHTSDVFLLAVLLVRGIGLGACSIPLNSAAFIGLSRTEIPDASIITRVAQQVGGSMGTAVLAVIVERTSAGLHAPAALANAFGDSFWWAVAFTAAAIPVCLLLPGRPQTRPPADVSAKLAVSSEPAQLG